MAGNEPKALRMLAEGDQELFPKPNTEELGFFDSKTPALKLGKKGLIEEIDLGFSIFITGLRMYGKDCCGDWQLLHKSTKSLRPGMGKL